VERLAEAGVDVAHENFPGMMHGFYAFAPTLDAATRARAVVADGLRRRLGGPGGAA
jgi:acetyl esterase/lipase